MADIQADPKQDGNTIDAELSAEDARLLLTASRAKIDSVDRKIVDLLNERTRMVEDIGRAKMVLDMPVKEPNREESVYRNVLHHNRGPIPDNAIKRIFEQLMKEMRELQGMRREPSRETTGEKSSSSDQ